MYNKDRVSAYLAEGGFSQEDITGGIAYADEMEAGSDDEAPSLAISWNLYSEEALADGQRYGVEPGSW